MNRFLPLLLMLALAACSSDTSESTASGTNPQSDPQGRASAPPLTGLKAEAADMSTATRSSRRKSSTAFFLFRNSAFPGIRNATLPDGNS